MRSIHIHRSRGVITADRLMGKMEGMARRDAMPRIKDQPNLQALYDELLHRMAGALHELTGRTADGVWREELHPRKSNGQFGKGAVPPPVDADMENSKPTTTTAKGGMDKIRELFASGHAFSKEEFLAATGLKEKRLSDYLAMLKNEKWAGPKGALKIERDAQGRYFVARADGTPAPPPPVPAPQPRITEHMLQSHVDSIRRQLNDMYNEQPGFRSARGAVARQLVNGVATGLASGFGSDPEYAERYAQQLREAHEHLVATKREYEAYLSEKRAAAAKTAEQDQPAKVATVAPPGKFEQYVPQKTAEAAAEFGRRHNYADAIDFGKLDVSVANQHMQAVSEHLAEFPALRSRLGSMGSTQAYYKAWHDRSVKAWVERTKLWRDTGKSSYWAGKSDADIQKYAETSSVVRKPKAPGRAWALAHGGTGIDSAITFNEKYLAKGKAIAGMDATLKRNVEMRWHPPGCDTIKSIADHELGHQMDNLLGLRNSPKVAQLYSDALKGSATLTNPSGRTVNAGQENMKNNVSQYAYTNRAEFIAEAWAEYRNSPNPRPFAKAVGDLIRSEYAAKFGKA